MCILCNMCLKEKAPENKNYLIKLLPKIIDILVIRANKFSFKAQAGLSWFLSLKIKKIKINTSIYVCLEHFQSIS